MMPSAPPVKTLTKPNSKEITKNVAFHLKGTLSVKLNSEACCSVEKVLFHGQEMLILDGANKKLKVFSIKGNLLTCLYLHYVPKHGSISPAGNIFLALASHLSFGWYKKTGVKIGLHKHIWTKQQYSLVQVTNEEKLVCCMDSQPGQLHILDLKGQVLHSLDLYKMNVIIMGHSHLTVSTDGNIFALNGYTIDGSDIFLCMYSNGNIFHKLVDKKMEIGPRGVHTVLNSFYLVCKDTSSILHISITNDFEPYFIPLTPWDYFLRFDDIFFIDNQSFLISHQHSELVSLYSKS